MLFNLEFFEKLARFGRFDTGFISVEADDKTSVLFVGRAGQNRLHQIALTFYREVQNIRSDTRLSAEGHADKIKTAAIAALKEVDKADSEILQRVIKDIETMQKKVEIPAANNDLPVASNQTLREIEIRGYILKESDASKRLGMLKEAVASLDFITFAAFANAPKFLNIVNEKTLEEAKRIFAIRQNPTIAKELGDAMEVRDILTRNFAQLREGIGTAGQLIDDSTRARLQRLAQDAIDNSQRVRIEPHRLANTPADTAGNPASKADAGLKVNNR